MTTNRIRGAKIVGALAVIGLTLGAAAPVHAEPKEQPAKRGCLLQLPDRYEGYYDGDTVTITDSNGTKSTYKCNDGKWERVPSIRSDPRTRVVIGGTAVRLVLARP